MRSYKTTIAALTMIFTVSGNVSAQSELGNFLGNLINKTSQNKDCEQQDDKKGSLLEGLSNIFNKNKIASEDELVGSWEFSSPAIIFESQSMLENMGGKAVANRMEQRITEILNKYGLTKETMKFEFDNEKNFRQSYKKINLKGTYSVEDKNVVLKYAGRYKQLVGETQIDGDNLIIVMDIEKLNEYLISLANLSPDPKIKSLSKILSRIKGMKCGMRFEKIA